MRSLCGLREGEIVADTNREAWVHSRAPRLARVALVTNDEPTSTTPQPRQSLQTMLSARFASAIDSAMKHSIEYASGEPIRQVEAVRRIRKATKVLRAVIALASEAAPVESLAGADRMLGDTSSLLSPIRDRDAMLATIERLLGANDDARIRQARMTLTAVVLPTDMSADADGQSKVLRDLLVQQAIGILARLTAASHHFRFECVTVDGVVDAISESWRAARRLASSEWATADSEASHVLRKQCSRLAIQLAIVDSHAPRSIRQIRKGLRAITSSLGREHDLAMLAERISLERSSFPNAQFVATAIELCARARCRMRDQASSNVDRTFSIRTKSFRRGLNLAVSQPDTPLDQGAESQ